MTRTTCPGCGRGVDLVKGGRLAFHAGESGAFCPGSLTPAQVPSLLGRPLPPGWQPRPQTGVEVPTRAHR